MEAAFIIAVALATVLTLLIVGLVVAVLYYRWRTSELMEGISAFIRKNWKLEKQIGELETELKGKQSIYNNQTNQTES